MASIAAISLTVLTGTIAIAGIYRALKSGLRPEPVTVTDQPFPTATSIGSSPALTASGVFWAVFGALWAFSITAGIIYSLFRSF